MIECHMDGDGDAYEDVTWKKVFTPPDVLLSHLLLQLPPPHQEEYNHTPRLPPCPHHHNPYQRDGKCPSFQISPPNQLSFPQAITHTVLYAVGPLPLQLALLWSNVFYWTMYINEGVLISLSLTRLYLLITVRALFKRKTKITVFYPPRSPVTTLFLAACDNIV